MSYVRRNCIAYCWCDAHHPAAIANRFTCAMMRYVGYLPSHQDRLAGQMQLGIFWDSQSRLVQAAELGAVLIEYALIAALVAMVAVVAVSNVGQDAASRLDEMSYVLEENGTDSNPSLISGSSGGGARARSMWIQAAFQDKMM